MRVVNGKVVVVAVSLATALVASSCGDSMPAADTAPEPRIDLIVGDVLPLTGHSAGLGVSAQKAAQIAVEKLNHAIGDANVDHSLEIVHEDGAARGVAHATRELIGAGAGCIVGPRARSGMAALAALPPSLRPAVVISPRARLRAPRRAIVVLPPAGPQRSISGDGGDGEPRSTAAFASLYDSTDPPIGPARTSDARQFDAVVLCYLSAVAAGTTGPRMAASVGPPRRWGRHYTWQHLSDAILALEAGAPITYRGVSGRYGLTPPG